MRQSLSPDTGGSAATNRVAIMQPTYLGWCGYFAMLDQADTFVLLDTVPVDTKSWQTRNRIRARDGNTVWLSVPILGGQGQRIDQVLVDNTKPWQAKHWRTIKAAYSHSPGWQKVAVLAGMVGSGSWHQLGDLNHMLIRQVCRQAGIATPIVRASSLPEYVGDDRVGRINHILDHLHATSFLATPGSTFLADHTHIGETPIEWFTYNHPTYTQTGMEWQPYLSVLDLLAYQPDKALSIIRHEYAPPCEITAQSGNKHA